MRIPKIYIERRRNKDGKIILTEFPRGLAGKKMFDKLLKAKLTIMKGGRI